MFRMPADDFAEWLDTHSNYLSRLPGGFRVRTRVVIKPAKGLPAYLKSKTAKGFVMGARTPRKIPYLANTTLEAMGKIKRKGWDPESVEVFVRWEPKT